MSNPILRLKSILKPYFSEALKTVRAKEERMKVRIRRMPHKPTTDDKQLYYEQYKIVSQTERQIKFHQNRIDQAYLDKIDNKL